MFFVLTPLICRMKRNFINELDSSFFRDRKQIINNQLYIMKQSGTKLIILCGEEFIIFPIYDKLLYISEYPHADGDPRSPCLHGWRPSHLSPHNNKRNFLAHMCATPPKVNPPN